MKRLLKFLLVMSLLFITYSCFPYNKMEGKIIKVIDGDTFWYSCKYGTFKARLAAIDAPEITQEYGIEAKNYISRYLNKPSSIIVMETDCWGRALVYLKIGNVDINLLMIASGNAWHYSKYNSDSTYAFAQKLAKYNKVGLWSNNNPMEPWEYRKKFKKKDSIHWNVYDYKDKNK